MMSDSTITSPISTMFAGISYSLMVSDSLITMWSSKYAITAPPEVMYSSKSSLLGALATAVVLIVTSCQALIVVIASDVVVVVPSSIRKYTRVEVLAYIQHFTLKDLSAHRA